VEVGKEYPNILRYGRQLAAENKEFLEQLKEVEVTYPLVALAFQLQRVAIVEMAQLRIASRSVVTYLLLQLDSDAMTATAEFGTRRVACIRRAERDMGRARTREDAYNAIGALLDSLSGCRR